jgi:hypothetical protein
MGTTYFGHNACLSHQLSPFCLPSLYGLKPFFLGKLILVRHCLTPKPKKIRGILALWTTHKNGSPRSDYIQSRSKSTFSIKQCKGRRQVILSANIKNKDLTLTADLTLNR